MAKQFASHGDMEDKKKSFIKLSENAYAYTAEGDPNTGVVIGDDSVMVIDTQATPVMAQDVIAKIREVTDKPIKHVVMTHYHAVRVLGASAYKPQNIIASKDTYDMLVERGQQDFDSEVGRFPRLFKGLDTVPGLTWPNIVFEKEITFWLGSLEVKIMQIGRGHTKGDTIVWLPKDKVLFSGDLVEYGATPYTGDAYHKDWPTTLENMLAMGPEKLVPGRGEALQTAEGCKEAIDGTRQFVSDMFNAVKAGRAAGKNLTDVYVETYRQMQRDYGHLVIFEHSIPFDIARCFDEAGEYADPRIWTAERDKELWHSLEAAVAELES